MYSVSLTKPSPSMSRVCAYVVPPVVCCSIILCIVAWTLLWSPRHEWFGCFLVLCLSRILRPRLCTGSTATAPGVRLRVLRMRGRAIRLCTTAAVSALPLCRVTAACVTQVYGVSLRKEAPAKAPAPPVAHAHAHAHAHPHPHPHAAKKGTGRSRASAGSGAPHPVDAAGDHPAVMPPMVLPRVVWAGHCWECSAGAAIGVGLCWLQLEAVPHPVLV